MRIGWHQFIKSKFQRKSEYYAVGISLAVDTASFCALRLVEGEPVVALYQETPIGNWQQALVSWTETNNIGLADCSVSIARQQHTDYQVEKPSVEAAEMHQALTWPVKEMAGSEAPELVFDYYEPPAQSAGSNKVTVVAIPKENLERIIEAVVSAGLRLQSVIVEELAACDLIETEEPVLTLLQRAGEEIQLAIVKNGQLYFTRSLKGFENLGGFSIDELKMGVLDSLTVQIQRSMDYFESQLRQAPIRKIFMNIESANSDVIGEQISSLMRVDVSSFVPNMKSDVDDVQNHDFSCLAAALAAKNSEYGSRGKAA